MPTHLQSSKETSGQCYLRSYEKIRQKPAEISESEQQRGISISANGRHVQLQRRLCLTEGFQAIHIDPAHHFQKLLLVSCRNYDAEA